MSENTISTAPLAPDNGMDSAVNAFASILAPEEDNQEEGKAQQPDVEETEGVEAEDEAEQVEEGEEPDADAEDDADPEDEDESDGDEAEQPVYTIKVNGEEVEVTLDELQKGYSRTQDYTRKTQQLAEMRKAAEVETEAVRSERQQYSQLLEAMRQQVAASNPAEPNWEYLRKNDPIEFAAQWADHERRHKQMAAIQSEQVRLAEIQNYEQAQQLAAIVAQEKQILEEAIPEWKEPETAKREKAALVEFGKQIGFKPEELANITDHRAVVALRKAYLYDKLMAKKPQVLKSTQKTAPTLKPGTSSAMPRKNSDLVKAKQRLAKSGAVQDAAAAFENLLLGKGY
jgi:hypothetical protein